jgi:hypothetical protein
MGGQPWHEGDADAGGDELELDRVVGRLGQGDRLLASRPRRATARPSSKSDVNRLTIEEKPA